MRRAAIVAFVASALLAVVVVGVDAIAQSQPSMPFSPSSSSSGMSTSQGDARYLKLDASNDSLSSGDLDWQGDVRSVDGCVQSLKGSTPPQDCAEIGGGIYAANTGSGSPSIISAAIGPTLDSAWINLHAYGPSHVGNGYCLNNTQTQGGAEIVLRGADSGGQGVAICSAEGTPLRLGVAPTTAGMNAGIEITTSTVSTQTNQHLFSATPTTCSSPSISWIGNTSLGIVRSAANQLDICANGATSMRFTSNTSITPFRDIVMNGARMRLIDGTAASPAINFNTDQTVGLYRVSSGVGGASASNTTAYTWSSSAVTAHVPVQPSTDDAIDLGSSSVGWRDVYVANSIAGRSNAKGLVISDADGITITDDGIDWTFVGLNMRHPQSTSTDAATTPTMFLPRRIFANTSTGTAPSCSNSSHAGQIVYVDRTNDSVAADICVCHANSSNAYAWRKITDLSTACTITP